MESIQLLKKKPRRDIIKKLRAAMDAVEEGRPVAATEGVGTPATRRTLPHVVPTSTNPTNSRILSEKPRTHLKITRANTPGTTPAIVAPDPAKRRSRRLNPDVVEPVIITGMSSDRIPLCQPNLISQEAVNAVTESAVYANNAIWTPSKYLLANVSTSAGSNLDGDIEHFCAPVVHPETGETITSYKS